MPGSLLLVGAGKMGSALLGGWLAQGTAPSDVLIVEPDARARAEITRKAIAAHANASDLPADIDPQTIVFAVKYHIYWDMNATPAQLAMPERLHFGTRIVARPIH